MHHLITVEFWKQLFDYLQKNVTESTDQQIYPLTFELKKYLYYLESFNVLSHKKKTESPLTINGSMILVDKNKLGYGTANHNIDGIIYFYKKLGGESKEGDLLLAVSPEWKHFQVSYQLFQFKNCTPIALTNIKVINIRECIGETAILEGAGKNNLELMKIRLAPEINFEKIYSLKVLIIGSGTLGCNVARGLLSWGVEYITFIDNAKVGASNLLRQSLFESSDLGKNKALAAAERIANIFPPAKSKVVGLEMTIPMPDHPDTSNNICDESDKVLDDLIKNSDIIFLCTDNRESRWLPSLIANIHNRPLINLALGFDSYVVMRHPLSVLHYEVTFPKLERKLVEDETGLTHGKFTHQDPDQTTLDSCSKRNLVVPSVMPPLFHSSSASVFTSSNAEPTSLGGHGLSITSIGKIAVGSHEIGSSYGSISYSRDHLPDVSLDVEQFGCYFCPSVEGVKNSVKDQALDERCTVTRGGASMIASALAVELAIGLVTHKKGFYASGGKNCEFGADESLLKLNPPQQIRGNLKDFSNQQYLVRRNPNCVCCSRQITQYYEDPKSRARFLQGVCQDSSLLLSIVDGDQFECSLDHGSVISLE